MKKWLFVLLGYVLLIGVLYFTLKEKAKTEAAWKTATANVKAYDKLLSNSKEKNVAYQLTIDQLNVAQDSLLKDLNETREKLKVKDKNLKSVQYITSTFVKTDTLILPNDTLFRDTLNLDTLIEDDWYKAKLHLQYPSMVVVSPQFKSGKTIVVSTKKETVKPPKRCWLLRLFQKKHTILNVQVVEKNPYVIGEESRYVEILK